MVESYRDDPRFLGLIIGGSVAKGYARNDSDVDFLSIATDEAFEEHRRARDLFINRRELCDYGGGFVDGKIINLANLEDVAGKGNEPSRAAFEGAFAAFSKVPDLQDLLHRIPVYPEAGHDERATALFELIRNFQDWGVSDLEAYTWFMTDIEWSWMDGTTAIEDW